MNVSQYISQFRALTDDNSPMPLWTDLEIALWTHQGYYELAKLAKCIRDKTTSAVCSITIVASQSAYTLHSKIIEIYSVKHSGKYSPVEKTSEMELDVTVSNWWNKTADVPEGYYTDTEFTKLFLYPTPSSTATGTLSLAVARLPMIDLFPYTSGQIDNSPSEIREDWQPYILDYVMHKAYMKDDVETFNEKKSAAAKVRFLDNVDQVKRDIIRITRKERSFGMHWGTL